MKEILISVIQEWKRKEEEIKMKEIAFEKDLKLKEKDIEVKDKVIEVKLLEIETNKKEISLKDLKIKDITREYLMSSGALTSRGIFEWNLKLAHSEIFPFKTKFNVSDFLIYLMNNKSQPLLNSPYTSKIYNIFQKCDICTKEDAVNLYEELCVNIHGSPWTRNSVPVYVSKLLPKHRCVIQELASSMDLKTESADEND